jgi:SAM-dependent methyltransferase
MPKSGFWDEYQKFWDEYWKAKRISVKIVNFMRKYYFSKIFVEYIENFAGANKKILEVGCGSCDILKRLGNKGYDIFGIDKSKTAVINARRKGLKIKLADVLKNPYKDETFDLVFSVSVAEHLENPAKFLKECIRVTKKNRYVLTVIPSNHKFYRLLFMISWYKIFNFLWPWHRLNKPTRKQRRFRHAFYTKEELKRTAQKMRLKYFIEPVPRTFGIFHAVVVKSKNQREML